MQITRKPNGRGTLNITVKIDGEQAYKYDDIFVETITDEALERALDRCISNDRERREMKARRKALLKGE